SRKSQWRRVASCFWTMKRLPPSLLARFPEGSAVRAKSRLRLYSASGSRFAIARLPLLAEYAAAFLVLDQPQQREKHEADDRGDHYQRPLCGAAGDADDRRDPQVGGRGEVMNLPSAEYDQTGPENAHKGTGSLEYAQRIHPVAVELSVERDDRNRHRGRREADQRVGAHAGFVPAQLAVETEQNAEDRRGAEAREQIPVHPVDQNGVVEDHQAR